MCVDGARVAEDVALRIVTVLRLGDERTVGHMLADRTEPADAVEDGIVAVDGVTAALYSNAGLTRMFAILQNPCLSTCQFLKSPGRSEQLKQRKTIDIFARNVLRCGRRSII